MKIPVIYVIGAILFGLVAAFGIAAMTYHPLPVQVQVNQYAPVRAPEPAIPTIAPVHTPSKPFDPAPAPVVVTTQPLPSITPENNPNEVKPVMHCNISDDSMVSVSCMTEEVTDLVVGMPVAFILWIVLFVSFLFAHITRR